MECLFSWMKHGFIFLGCFLVLSFAILLNVSFAQFAPRVDIPSSPNPVGSGARALGMGGAFIAVADDATSASWNPGGLIQLETPEVSIVGTFISRSENNTFGTNPEASGKQSVSWENINYLSLSYPFVFFKRNMIVSLNYQRLYDFRRDWQFPLTTTSNELSLDRNFEHRLHGVLSAIGIAYCIQATPTLSFGFTLNFWENAHGDWPGSCKWKRTDDEIGSGIWTPSGPGGPSIPITYEHHRLDRYHFDGFNTNFGVMWNVNHKLTFGAVLKTPFTADLEHEFSSSTYLAEVGGGILQNDVVPLTTVDEELDMPMSYGIGFAYRVSDQLTASADFYRTEWQDFILKKADGSKVSAISNLPKGESDVKATYQLRVGMEYLLIKPGYVIPFRGGIFYDPAPSEDGTDDFYGFSIGTGIAYGKIIFDIAYQYRFGRDVGSSTVQTMDFSQDVDEHMAYGSLIVHF